MKKLIPIIDFKKTSSNTFEFEVKWETPEGYILEDSDSGFIPIDIKTGKEIKEVILTPELDTPIADPGIEPSETEAPLRRLSTSRAAPSDSVITVDLQNKEQYIEHLNKFRYFWDFGDGNYSIEKNPIHTYRAPGNFPVSFNSTNGVHGPKERPPKEKEPLHATVVGIADEVGDTIPDSPTLPMAPLQYVHLDSEATIGTEEVHIPRGGKFLVLIKYRNPGFSTIAGKIVLSYNLLSESINRYLLAREPIVENEEWVQPSQPEATYRDAIEYYFDELGPQEEHVIKQYFWVNPNLDLITLPATGTFHSKVELEDANLLITDGIVTSELTITTV